MHDIERKYTPREWERIPLDKDIELSVINTHLNCTADSFRAFQLMERGVVPFLVDYEWMSAGEDPTCGGGVYFEYATNLYVIDIYVSNPNSITGVDIHRYRQKPPCDQDPMTVGIREASSNCILTEGHDGPFHRDIRGGEWDV